MKEKNKTFIDCFALVCAVLFVVLSLYGNFLVGSKEFARQLGAAIGVSAGVLPNEYNMLAQSLLQKETEINQRERELAEREAAVLEHGSGKDTLLVFMTLSVGFLLLFLILLNFYLDWRGRQIKK